MDFDNAKENIQPLATGRNASILQASLRVESPQELMAQRQELEQAIHNYNGDDPLEPWYTYISWIEQSYPSGGKESGLDEVLTKCLSRFESEERYYQDRRMIKLYMKFIDSHHQPTECYQQLFNAGIGTMVADFYICWAYHYDLCGNSRKADEIFRRGLACRAQPIEELQEAHQHFGFSVAQRMMYQDDVSVRENTKQQFEERRLALTSLRGHRRKATVGSIRTGGAVKKCTPGTIQVDPSCSARRGNSRVQVFHDENASPNVLPLALSVDAEPDNATPEDGKSVVHSIIDAARNQENMKEPGPWNKAHYKKTGKLFSKTPKTIDLGFSIHEDNDVEMETDKKCENPLQLTIAEGELNYNKPFKFPPNFKHKNLPLPEWNTPVTIENEVEPRTFPQYNKCFLYPRPNMEFQPEELCAFYKLRKRGISNQFTKKFELVWSSRDINANMRCYPNFAKNSRPQQLKEIDAYYSPEQKSGMIVCFKALYNAEEKVEYQLEELMAKRLRRNETIITATDMDETTCGFNEKAQRRKSFFPTRRSIAPKMRATIIAANERLAVEANDNKELPAIEETNIVKTMSEPSIVDTIPCQNRIAASASDDPAQLKDSTSLPIIQTVKPVIPFEIYEDTTIATSKTTTTVCDSKAALQRCDDTFVPEFKFKTPAVPGTCKANKLPFEIYTETSLVESGAETPAGLFDAEETCSTQTFNIFLKSQSVSTPKLPQKSVPRLFGSILKGAPNPAELSPSDISPIAMNNIDESEIIVKNASETPGSVIGQAINSEYSPLQPKQLSTILETSEHGTTQGTHNTVGTTKSSSSSSEGDGEQVIVRLTMPQTGLETVEEQSRELSVVPADVIVSMENIKLQCDPQSKDKASEISRQERQQSMQGNLSVSNTPANLRLQPISVGQGIAVSTAGALNFSIFQDEPTTDIMKMKQAGNFTRMDEREDTSTALAIRSVRFQEDKTETIPKMLLSSVVKFQEDKTETMSKILLAPPTLAQFESEKEDTMPKMSLQSPLLPEIDATNLDDSFEFFRQTPPGKIFLKTLKTDMSAFFEHMESRSPVVSAAKRLCDKDTPILHVKSQTTTQHHTSFADKSLSKKKAQPLFKEESTSAQKHSVFKPSTQLLPQAQTDNSIPTVYESKKLPRAVSRDSFMPDFSFIEETQPQTNTDNVVQTNISNAKLNVQQVDTSKLCDSYLGNSSMAIDSQQKPAANKNIESSFVMDSQPAMSAKKCRVKSQLEVQEQQLNTDSVHSYTQDNLRNKMNVTSLNKGTNDNNNDSYFEKFSIVMDSQPPQISATKTAKKQIEVQEVIMKSSLGNSYLHDFSNLLDAQPQTIVPAQKCRQDEPVVETEPTAEDKMETEAKLELGNSYLKDFSVVMDSQPAENVKSLKQNKLGTAKSKIPQPSKYKKVNNINDSYLKDFSIAMESQPIRKPTTEAFNKSITNKPQSQQTPIFLESFMRDFSAIQEPPEDFQKTPTAKPRLTFLNESKKLHESTQELVSMSTKAATATTASNPLSKFNFVDAAAVASKRVSRDEFFEYNAETEMFAASNSMIKNSTWLPNYESQQIKEQSIHIKSEPIDENAKELLNNQQLNIFEFKTPKLPVVKPEVGREVTEPPTPNGETSIDTTGRPSLNISTQHASIKNRLTEEVECKNKSMICAVPVATSTESRLVNSSQPIHNDKMCADVENNQNMSISLQDSLMKNRAIQENLPEKFFVAAATSRTSRTVMELVPATSTSVASTPLTPAQHINSKNMCNNVTNNQSMNISMQNCSARNNTIKESKSDAAESRGTAQIESDEAAESSNNDNDAELSIYYKNTPKTPVIQNHIWNEDSPSPKTPTNNKYVHPDVDLNATAQIIDDMFINPNGNPFNSHLQSAFLERIDFSNYISELPNCMMVGHVSRLHSSLKLKVNDEEFEVLKLLGEGAYGTVFCGVNHKTGIKYALKQERPPNFWEYYICLEVQSRLSLERLPAYMSVDYALFGNNSSILISSFSPYGSLISVCNTVKRYTSKNVDEYVVMLLACEMLDIIDHLHAAGIIHADIKADNFLLMKKLEYSNEQRAMQLIDFGVSVDMKLYKPGQTFNYVHHQDAFKCVEMREGKPWTYQLDLYGLAGVIHVLLFGKFMEIEQRVNGFWMHKTHVPRYFNKQMWDTIFQTLLNIRNCESMPNLQRLRALLKEELVEKEKFVVRKINDFNMALNA